MKRVTNYLNTLLTQENCLSILKVTCAVIFIGRGWQHFFWDAPFRSVLWDQELMENFIQRYFNLEWNDYVTDEKIDQKIQRFISFTGLIFWLSAVSVFTIKRFKKLSTIVISLGVFILLITAFGSFKTRFFQVGEWLEFGIQIFSPIIFLLFIHQKWKLESLILLAKIAIAITFIGHGFYAFGYYPQPGNYVDMVIKITGFEEDFVKQLLKVMGAIDFGVAFLIFIPNASKPALIYCVIWGFLTAMARIVSLFDFNFALMSLHQSLHLTVFRLSHSLLPLWVLFETIRVGKSENEKSIQKTR